jgi:hypothetical protein
LYQIWIFPSTSQNIQTRQVFDILDYLGIVGGIFDIFKFFLQVFLAPLPTHSFLLKAISTFYVIKLNNGQ